MNAIVTLQDDDEIDPSDEACFATVLEILAFPLEQPSVPLMYLRLAYFYTEYLASLNKGALLPLYKAIHTWSSKVRLLVDWLLICHQSQSQEEASALIDFLLPLFEEACNQKLDLTDSGGCPITEAADSKKRSSKTKRKEHIGKSRRGHKVIEDPEPQEEPRFLREQEQEEVKERKIVKRGTELEYLKGMEEKVRTKLREVYATFVGTHFCHRAKGCVN